MRLSACAAVVIVVLLAFPLIPSGSRATSNPPLPLGGFVDSIRFIEQPNQAQALLDLDNGAMDLYTPPLRTPVDIQTAHTNPNLRTADAYGGENNLFVNPLPVNQALAPGVFNPFSVREIREALNYLIDRNYVNQITLGGYGITHAALWNNASPEVARDPFFFADVNRAAGYDFDRARTIIFNALNASGATYNGTWSWQGNPIIVPVIIRIEDFRRQLGEYVADQIAGLGLSVNRRYLSGGAAFAIVYNGPPDTGAWMLYTEGWQSTMLQRWPDGDLYFFDCGGEGSQLWSQYSPPAALLDVCTRLLNGQYSSQAERQQLIESGVTLALNNSVRVWLVAGQTQAYSARVTAVAADAASGLWSPFTVRTARFATPGGNLVVGQRLQFLSPFQPWQGFGWLYDSIIGNTIMDPGVTPHPRTGAYVPVRSEFQTTTAGPSGTLAVPIDALTWDSTTLGFKPVGAGTTSKSKVTFQYTLGTWHDGVAMSVNDVLYNVALIMRRAMGDVALHDGDAVNTHDRGFTTWFRGLKVINPTTLDVYVDYWDLDPSFIAAAADVWPATPWEVGEIAMATTLHDHTRISEVTAANDGLYPIDLVSGSPLNYMDHEISDGNITTSGASVTRPPALESYITQSEAEARWSALQTWRTSHGHYFVSNGPYFLDSVDLVTFQATATNFVAYPFPANRWDGLVSPPTPVLAIDPIANVIQGQPGQVNMTTTANSLPDDNATVSFRIRPEHNATTLLAGTAVHVGPGEWQVNLDPPFTSNLTVGTYLFEAVATGNESAASVFADQTFQVTSGVPDSTAPTSSIDTLSAYWHTAGPISLTITASDDRSGVASVDLYVAFSADGSSWSTPAWVTTDTSPPFAFDFVPTSGDGRYRFWSIAMDGAGNLESLSSKPAGDVEAGIDSAVPFASLVPLPGYWRTEATVSLQTTVSDGTSGLASVALFASYSSDGATWTTPTKVTTDTTSPFAFDYTAAQDGRYRLWALATDQAGNAESLAARSSTGEVSFGIDRIPPTATIAPVASYWHRSGPFSLDVTATDDQSGVLSVTLLVSYSADGVTWSTPTIAGTDSTAPFQFSYSPAQGDGRYRFWAWAMDAAGNLEPVSSPPTDPEAEAGLDSVAPSILSSGPSDGASGVAATTPIRIRFSEGVDHATAEAAFSITPSVQGTFSWEGDALVFTPSASLAAGTTYQVTVHAGVTDTAGNGLATDYRISFATEASTSPTGISGTVVVATVAIGVAALIAGALLVWRRSVRRRP